MLGTALEREREGDIPLSLDLYLHSHFVLEKMNLSETEAIYKINFMSHYYAW